MQWTQQQIDECIEACRRRAAVDAGFRGKLLSDPAAAIRELSGREIPAGFRIKVLENDPAYDATFVLPPPVAGGVSDNELDDVAGGAVCGSYACEPHACGTHGKPK
ncbi:nitrile hydratase [Victivallaceae bacterium BBE-744-WT-12]|uniref:Nitrile hydratase n=1 Tax=Victivallis lenta TaxID=2606640 RepID=A0A844G350_9BACT|nr:nitrile hydratase [Victivallis lenta]AVM44275.1 nitrile hydratase [Victivallales bacterium CCUG 44730]MBS5529241.1 nitrile hydratase [bacterium]MST96958.1 nitrile hydratase [Victivallis lenta]